jgi:hypothetical protein
MKRFWKYLATTGLMAGMLLGVSASALAEDRDHDAWRDRREAREHRYPYYRNGWGWRDRDHDRDRDRRWDRDHDRDRDRAGWRYRDRDHDGDRH